ncbi:AAA family ATPase [Ralstonia sp. UBA689]|uniref:bifunctional aminoglycoside phosphotransferase/ATP-binding protein n=1 Tax=Ralstonia sp. UBA689 TaxID=1947373 RepID=UPI0025DED0A0|nr:bifunctional aminoglycoside phosphotransferase/ATP-binding protein [Ralstonia sp. UBA689]
MPELSNSPLTSQDAEALVAGMLDAAAYPHPAADLRMIETHLSWVFLAGAFAYKVRKPVTLDFVDFSSPAARQADCDTEWRLNRRLAPDLYLGVVPISRDPATGAIRVSGRGEPIEYAVCMRRFHQQDLLSTMALDRRLGPREIDSLADLIADFHRAAPLADLDTDYGTPARIQRTLEDCAAGAVARSTDLRQASDSIALLSRQAALLEKAFASRRRTGHIRECHGDLHLGNIVLLDGKPTPFDCLEFSAPLRWIDTMYDVAFLFMDLLASNHPQLAYRLINRYLERCGDYGGLPLLPFYASMRALVRARVLLERAHQLEEKHTPELAAAQRDEAHRLLDLSQSLISRRDGCILLMHGLSGSGKSTRAAELAESEGMIRARSDTERRHGGCTNPADRYTPRAIDQTYRRLAAICKIGVSAGFPVIADATFLAERQRKRFFALARRLGVPILIADCAADPSVLRMRIRSRMRDGRDPSEADLSVLSAQMASQQPLTAEERAHVVPGGIRLVLPYLKRMLAKQSASTRT